MADKIQLSLDADQVSFLCNAINETCEALEDWEFQTRTGSTRQEAEEIRKILDQALQPKPAEE